MVCRFPTPQWLSQAGLWCLGLTVALLSGPSARAQQEASKEPPSGPSANQADRDGTAAKPGTESCPAGKSSAAEQKKVREWLEQQARAAMCGQQARHPDHERMILAARAEVELLEAQIEAKKAQARLVEARLKAARSRCEAIKKLSATGAVDNARRVEAEGEVMVLEAELDAERAEIKEPQVLLKYARRQLEDLEEFGQSPVPMSLGGMGMMGHPGMGMGMMPPMGRHPGELQHFGMQRMSDVDDRLMQLREAIENLEEHMDRLANRRDQEKEEEPASKGEKK